MDVIFRFMAHYALINGKNIVESVFVGPEESQEFDWEKIYSERTGKLCKRTSYNTRGGIHYINGTSEKSPDQSKAFRKNYAGIGYTYDTSKDAFIPPRPYPSWTLNEETCLWDPPTPYPEDGKPYDWRESQQIWVLRVQ